MIHYEPEELLDIELTQIGTDIRSVQSVAPRITPNKQIREAYGEDEIKLIVDVPWYKKQPGKANLLRIPQ